MVKKSKGNKSLNLVLAIFAVVFLSSLTFSPVLAAGEKIGSSVSVEIKDKKVEKREKKEAIREINKDYKFDKSVAWSNYKRDIVNNDSKTNRILAKKRLSQAISRAGERKELSLLELK